LFFSSVSRTQVDEMAADHDRAWHEKADALSEAARQVRTLPKDVP
jgi:hypothetical protein